MDANSVLASVRNSETNKGEFVFVRMTKKQGEQLADIARQYDTTSEEILSELIAQFLGGIFPEK